MPGEFDSQLKWPFCGTITIQLVNQLEDNQHHNTHIRYSTTTSDRNSAQVTDKKRSSGWGKSLFIPHTELGLHQAKNRQYLKEDCLLLHIAL